MLVERQLLFIQGGGPGVHDGWDAKLVESLRRELGQGYEVRYPRMPHEEVPSYASWKRALRRELERLTEGAIVVAHSVGGTILLKLLAEHTPSEKLRGVFLLAVPFIGEGGWPADELRFPAHLGARLPEGVPIHFFHGLEDKTAPASHVDLYQRAVPQAHIHRLPGRDHQLNNDLKEVAATIIKL